MKRWPVVTIAAACAVGFALHVGWYRSGAAGGEVVSGFGAALVAIGVAVVSGTFLAPSALNRATAGAMPQDRRTFAMSHDPEYEGRRRALWAEIHSAIVFERIGIGGVVLVGTLLNGYGPAIARMLHLRG